MKHPLKALFRRRSEGMLFDEWVTLWMPAKRKYGNYYLRGMNNRYRKTIT